MSKSFPCGLFSYVGFRKAIVATTATISSLTACVTIQTPPVTISPSSVSSATPSPSPGVATPTPVAVVPDPIPAIPSPAAPATPKAPAAPAGMLVLGTASTGQTVSLDTNSIAYTDGAYANATYYLGEEKVLASINCGQSYWTVKGDSNQYTPKSQATQNLVTLACQIRLSNNKIEGMDYAIVYDPPSNVRSSPNGSIKCVLEKMELISVSVKPKDTWLQTKACGGGWISETQVKPLRY